MQAICKNLAVVLFYKLKIKLFEEKKQEESDAFGGLKQFLDVFANPPKFFRFLLSLLCYSFFWLCIFFFFLLLCCNCVKYEKPRGKFAMCKMVKECLYAPKVSERTLYDRT